MPSEDDNATVVIPARILEELKTKIAEGEIVTPSPSKKDFNTAGLILELEVERDNIKQRGKVINFILMFIGFQFVVVAGMFLFCIHLMSNERLTQYEFELIFRVLQVAIVAITIEFVGYLGIVIRYLFRIKKPKQ